MAITVTVTLGGKVTLCEEVLQHLGIKPGDQLDVDLLPDGRVLARAKSRKPISRLYGILKRPERPNLSIEEINEAAADGWAGEP